MKGSDIRWGSGYLRRFTLHKFDLYVINVGREMQRFFPGGLTNVLGVGQGPVVRWHFDDDQFQRLGESVLRRTLRDAAAGGNHVRRMRDRAAQAVQHLASFERLRFSTLDARQLRRCYQQFLSAAGGTVSIIYAPLVIEGQLFGHAKRLVETNYRAGAFARRWASIVTPVEPIPVVRREYDWRVLASSRRVTPQRLARYHRRYCWYGMRFVDDTPTTLADCSRLLAAARRPAPQALRRYRDGLQRRRAEFRQTLRPFSRVERRFLRLVNGYSALRQERDVYRGTAYYFGHFLYREIRRRYGLSWRSLLAYTTAELDGLIASGRRLPPTEVQRRRRRFVYLLTGRRRRVVSQSRLVAAVLKAQLGRSRTARPADGLLTGQGAYPGVVRGSVRVLRLHRLAQDLRRFRRDEIMVAESTKPEYVPAMRLAAAVVTNEGGITSHAAIISRELKIPCVVGTKVATQVLKDGDRVEVDAQRGIIRKL